jgi:hypothetical protein
MLRTAIPGIAKCHDDTIQGIAPDTAAACACTHQHVLGSNLPVTGWGMPRLTTAAKQSVVCHPSTPMGKDLRKQLTL